MELERELCRLPEVNAARIVADSVGRPIEVHILATATKHPKQIARDVASVAMASFGLDLDRRIISVVQLDQVYSGNGGRTSVAVGGKRITIAGITAARTGLRNVVRVILSRDQDEGIGVAEGSIATTARPRLVAQATLDALRELVPAADCADVEMATVVRVGQREVAVASLVFVVPPHEEFVSGSAVVRTADESDAVARAVLDATNRRLPLLAPA